MSKNIDSALQLNAGNPDFISSLAERAVYARH